MTLARRLHFLLLLLMAMKNLLKAVPVLATRIE